MPSALGQALQSDFPILQQNVHDQPLVYFDNAATSHKPKQVIEAITNYYYQHNSNVHRGVHTLSDRSTQAWESARTTIAEFFGADESELILTRNTTEAMNGVAYGWADHHLAEGDVILTALMEHHSNLVTWQQVSARTGAKLELIQVDNQGRIDQADFAEKLEKLPVKLVALSWISNALGTVNPVQDMIQLVHRQTEARVVIDAAQAAPHIPINFAQLKADFLAFSGHKMLGPMGVGGLIVRSELLNSGQMQPWLYGGGMIAEVQPANSQFHPDAADRFTAGTPDVASAVGLAVACQYLSQLGMAQVEAHDRELVEATLLKLADFPQVNIVGPTDVQPGIDQLDRLGSVGFIYQDVHAHDVAQVLDSHGVAARSGHHCTMPLHTHFSWIATTRVSFQVYNHQAELDQLAEALWKVKTVFGK